MKERKRMKLNLQKNDKREGIDNKGIRKPTGCGIHPLFIWLLILPVIAYWIFSFFGRGREMATISYSEFYEQLKEGNVQEVVITGDKITGTYIEPVAREIREDKFTEKIHNVNENRDTVSADKLNELAEAAYQKILKTLKEKKNDSNRKAKGKTQTATKKHRGSS